MIDGNLGSNVKTIVRFNNDIWSGALGGLLNEIKETKHYSKLTYHELRLNPLALINDFV